MTVVLMSGLFENNVCYQAFASEVSSQADPEENKTEENTNIVNGAIEDETIDNELIENTISENVVSENVISKNVISENVVSENVVSENAVSENVASENMASENVIAENVVTEDAVTENVVAENAVTEDAISENEIIENEPDHDALVLSEIKESDPEEEEEKKELPPDNSKIRLSSNVLQLGAGQSGHTFAKESTGSGIEVIPENPSSYADSRYAFSLKASADTSINAWIEDAALLDERKDEQNKIVYQAPVIGKLDTVWHENIMPIYDACGIVPRDDALSGKIGVWIWNAGVYQGKKVHAKLTFYFSGYTYKERTTYPTYIISARQDGMIGIDLTDIGSRICFDLYTGQIPSPLNKEAVIEEELTGLEKIRVDMSLNFGDIDGVQDFGFRANDGEIVSKQVYHDCQIYYRDNVDVEGYEDYIWMYADASDLPVEPDTKGEFRIEMQDVSSFDIIYAGWTRFAYPQIPDFRYGPGESSFCTLYTQTIKRFETVCAQIPNRCFNPYEFGYTLAENKVDQLNNQRALLTYFTAYAFEPYSLPSPEKYVSDNDETNVTGNTLQTGEKEFTYEIRQFVPLERPDYRYNSFIIRDELPAGLTCKQIEIVRDDGSDASDIFETQVSIAEDARTLVQVLAKTENLKSQLFYNQTYRIIITVETSEEYLAERQKDPSVPAFENYSETMISSGSRQQNAVTETCKTYIEEDPDLVMPYIRITKKIDKASQENGCAFFIFRIHGDNGKWYVVSIRIPPGELQASADIQVAAETTGTAYTITELENVSYELQKIMAYTSNVIADQATGNVIATVQAHRTTEGLQDHAELEFFNSYYDGCGLKYRDECVNNVVTYDQDI